MKKYYFVINYQGIKGFRSIETRKPVREREVVESDDDTLFLQLAEELLSRKKLFIEKMNIVRVNTMTEEMEEVYSCKRR